MVTQTPEDILGMSDEDFAKYVPLSPGTEAVTEAVADPVIEQVVEPVAETPTEPVVVADPVADPVAVETNPLADPDDKPAAAAVTPVAPVEAAAAPVEGATPPVEGEVKPDAAAAESAPINYEAVVKQIMAPFKANGKTIELKSPEEAITLMQMGANYTRKMQDLVPHRKLLTMLQNNNLDESRLSYLIDLDKKNPEAIKKLIKDSGIDPMDIDTAVEPAYLAGSHQVSDEEVNFKSALEELSSDPDGQKTLQVIDTQWDQASKQALWDSPEIMAVIHSHRGNGIYDRVAGEVDRLRTLGQIPAKTTFLEAYRLVGDELKRQGAFVPPQQQPTEGQAAPEVPAVVPVEPKVVAVRAAAPQSPVVADDRVSAASATRSTPKTAKEFVNPLAMSDDDFLKQMNGRL